MYKVTIIIPIYKDLVSISACIMSLKKYINKNIKILFINDMSNEWKEIEITVLDLINGYDNFYYIKNNKNLGFVKTCNKAVLELDKSDNDILLLNSDTVVTDNFLEEMLLALYSSENIGAVCPRSNKASFLSVPFNHNLSRDISMEESYYIYNKIKPYLIPVEEIWTGVGFAFLVKRELINKYGLFDESFGRGYNEENDFCMRIKKQGYKIMKCNNAYVFHNEGKSFLDEKNRLELINSSLLLRRYPDYWDKALEYENKIDSVDYFADLIIDKIYNKKRILLCILNKVNKNKLKEIIREIKLLITNYKDKCEFEIVVSKNIYYKLKYCISDVNILTPNKLNETYHIAFSFNGLTINDMIFLNKKALFIEKSTDINKLISKIIKIDDMCNNLDVENLRNRWKNNVDKDNNIIMKNQTIFKIKKYLYAHHIWLFIWWHKIQS